MLFLYAPLSVHAADFSANGFACNLADIELKQWWVLFAWGQWNSFKIEIYKTQSPDNVVTYKCFDIGNTTFGCTSTSLKQANSMGLAPAMYLTNFRPGITKGQACEIAINAARK